MVRMRTAADASGRWMRLVSATAPSFASLLTLARRARMPGGSGRAHRVRVLECGGCRRPVPDGRRLSGITSHRSIRRRRTGQRRCAPQVSCTACGERGNAPALVAGSQRCLSAVRKPNGRTVPYLLLPCGIRPQVLDAKTIVLLQYCRIKRCRIQCSYSVLRRLDDMRTCLLT
jgi:hypothetical protein